MKFIIIGCGRMGSGLAQVLAMRGHELTVVDSNPDAFTRLGPSFKGTMVAGVGFDRDVLAQAGVERADGLAAVTGSDEANVVVARLARSRCHVPRVVARVYDPRTVEIYRRLGIITIAPVTWGIARMAESLVHAQLNVVMSLGSGEVEIMEAEVPAFLAGRAVIDIAIPGQIRVIAVGRGGKVTVATSATVLQAGDVVHLAVAAGALGGLNEMLGMG